MEKIFAEKSMAIGDKIKEAEYCRCTIDAWIDLIHEWREAMAVKNYPITVKYLPEIALLRDCLTYSVRISVSLVV